MERRHRADRIQDLASPAYLANGAPIDTYSLGTGAASVDAAGASVTVGVDASTQTRYAPAFEITGWTSTTWTIRRGDAKGEVLASSAAPAGCTVLARYDAPDQKLVFVSLPAIPAGASALESSFFVTTE